MFSCPETYNFWMPFDESFDMVHEIRDANKFWNNGNLLAMVCLLMGEIDRAASLTFQKVKVAEHVW